MKILENVGTLVCKIPTRPPAFNLIESFVALVNETVPRQDIEENIVRETYGEFVTRV